MSRSDQAFCFYYPDNLELLEAAGAELVKFSPLNDQVLPDVDMLYLGGGYPELHGEALAGNVTMRAAIRKFAERGGTIYAECGGMMYLTQSIRDFGGTSHEMVGLFPAEAIMKKPCLTLGYRTLELSQDCILGASGTIARGHEFHYSTLVPRGNSTMPVHSVMCGRSRRVQTGSLWATRWRSILICILLASRRLQNLWWRLGVGTPHD